MVFYLEDGHAFDFVGDPHLHISQGGALLGKDGIEAVYKVKSAETDDIYALEVYDRMSSEAVKKIRLQILIGKLHPCMLWPLGITENFQLDETQDGEKPKIAVLFDDYADTYVSFVKILRGEAAFATKEKQLLALIKLVEVFEALHAQGYAHHDINDSIVRLDCQRGDVLISYTDAIEPDCVNILTDAENGYFQGNIKFMAPEVSHRMMYPDRYADRYSLAVLMFMLLTLAHPLDGVQRLQDPNSYMTQHVFVFDPDNDTNRPDPEKNANAISGWRDIPDFVKELFVRAFTSGIPAPNKTREQLKIERQNRPSERDWRIAFEKWMNTLVTCQNPECAHPISLQMEACEILPTVCPHCGQMFEKNLPVLVVKRRGRVVHTIVLDDGKEIPKRFISNEASNDTAMTVVQSKKVANVYGMRNILTSQWRCTQVGAKTRLVNNNDIVSAFNGVYIEFDFDLTGEIYQKNPPFCPQLTKNIYIKGE